MTGSKEERLHEDTAELIDLLDNVFKYGIGRPKGQLTAVSKHLVSRLRERYALSSYVEFEVEEESEIGDYVTRVEFRLRVETADGDLVQHVHSREGVDSADLRLSEIDSEEEAEKFAALLPVDKRLPIKIDDLSDNDNS
jgi:hypothetical protein